MKRIFGLVVALLLACPAFAGRPFEKIAEGGPTSPDGKTVVAVDMPVELRQHNIGSPQPRGPGCCVFRSIDHAARWQNVPALQNFPEWMVKNHVAGGGWPKKVDDLIPKIAADRKAPTPEYVQYEGKDPSILELALKSGRMPCITYNGHDGVHYSGPIGHMVNLVYLDAAQACILDNNFIGENQLVWMSRAEFLSRWAPGGQGWCVILLRPRPPAPPTN